jgi:hypothetical protein
MLKGGNERGFESGGTIKLPLFQVNEKPSGAFRA